MKNKLFKIVGIIFSGIIGLALVAFTIYVILYYPRKAESFEINTANSTNKVLIATQGSDFKDTFVKILCDSLQKSLLDISVIDVGDLKDVNEKDWDKILIINSFIIRLNKNVDQFVSNAENPGKIMLFVTSGGADWQPQPELMVDAITSASKNEFIQDLICLINNWGSKEYDQKWEPDDYLLALKYFPRVNIKAACESIVSEQERYMTLYPNLVNLINEVGYMYLRMKDINSALEVFSLNVNLFPGSWNVYDSYGEALFMNGDQEAALRNYTKALDLNPESKSAKDMLKKLDKD